MSTAKTAIRRRKQMSAARRKERRMEKEARLAKGRKK